jgi:RNA polymerase I-specific transcription initiation factor RRN7
MRRTASILSIGYSYPLRKSRLRLIDYPEILLVACLVVSTKCLMPFQDNDTHPNSKNTSVSLDFNWDRWQEIMRPHLRENESTDESDFKNVTPNKIATMTLDELDQYFAHVASLIENKS